MRLDDKTREIIKSEVASQLGVEAVVRLFGSRVDDTQRGGDIDFSSSLDNLWRTAFRWNAVCRRDCTSGWVAARSMC